jgi:hypothetical protein
MLDEQALRRREAAIRGAQTRRQRREQREAEARAQVEGERPTQGNVARNRRPRAHGDMLTVAVRGPIAERMRAMAERHGMSLAKLLQDMVLVYEGEVAGGYEVGTCLRGWMAEE